MTGVIYIPSADAWTYEVLLDHANNDLRYGETENHEIQFVRIEPKELNKALKAGKKGVGVYSSKYIRRLEINPVLRNVLLSNGMLHGSWAPEGFDSDKLGIVWKLKDKEEFSCISRAVESLLIQMSDVESYDSPRRFTFDRHHRIV